MRKNSYKKTGSGKTGPNRSRTGVRPKGEIQQPPNPDDTPKPPKEPPKPPTPPTDVP